MIWVLFYMSVKSGTKTDRCMSRMAPKVLMVQNGEYSKTIHRTLLRLQFPVNEEATDISSNQELNGADSYSDEVSDCKAIISFEYFTNTQI